MPKVALEWIWELENSEEMYINLDLLDYTQDYCTIQYTHSENTQNVQINYDGYILKL